MLHQFCNVIYWDTSIISAGKHLSNYLTAAIALKPCSQIFYLRDKFLSFHWFQQCMSNQMHLKPVDRWNITVTCASYSSPMNFCGKNGASGSRSRDAKEWSYLTKLSFCTLLLFMLQCSCVSHHGLQGKQKQTETTIRFYASYK